MWKLKKLTEGTVVYLVSAKHSYTVGRKNADIVLNEDSSISRKHCTIYISEQNEDRTDATFLTRVWVVDEHSKYGIYLKYGNEWRKLEGGEEVNLTNGSILKFGLMENIWRLEYSPVIACTSGIQAVERQQIANVLKLIDGKLKNAWSSQCSLVIVNEITLTVKVVLALINGVPIVTLNYIKKLIECVKNQSSLPDFKDYRPEIKETILDASRVSLDPTYTRKELFKGLTFIFPTKKQLEILRDVVVSAGGKAKLLPYSDNEWDKLGEKNVVVLQLPSNTSVLPEEQCIKFQEITAFLKNKYGRRVVPESEIAQSVAYSSIDTYCNPEFTDFSLRISEKKQNLGVVLVQETPDVLQEFITEPCVVPCSCIESTQDLTASEKNETLTGKKRNLSHDHFHLPTKIARIENELSEKEISIKEQTEVNKNKNDVVVKSKSKKGTLNTDDDNTSKNSFMTNYFKKQDVECSNTFWMDDPMVDNQSSKRKLPNENLATDEASTSKKRKSTKGNSPKNRDYSALPKVDVVEKNFSNTVYKQIAASVESKDLQELTSDFIGKDIDESVECSRINELDNTMYSLTLISSVFLKEDGSLKDPPLTPINVKKFRKKKFDFNICPTSSQEEEEKLIGGDWLEPHPRNFGDLSIF